MTAVAAWRDGMRRVARAPAILAGVWLVTALFVLPIGLALRAMLEQHLGSSLAADTAATGVNYDWMLQFGDQASGLGVTFRPTIIGFGAVLDNISGFLDNVQRPIAIVGAAAFYIVLWIFVTGGIIDRYARNRAITAHGFFATSGVFFFRFLRLAAIMAFVYALLFRYVHPWLFDQLYTRMVYEVTVERTAFIVRAVLYVFFGLALAGCNLVFDYAKVRAVVEDRRSMIAAITSAIGFIRRNVAAATALYLLNVVLFLAAVAIYAAVAPGASGGTLWAWIGLAVGQLYVLARLWVKLVFWASETALFQGQLAHAGYTATAAPTWPDSPMEEAFKT